ncbi:hypothetical protein C8Q79DRAFT_959325 [Trametes meyenii]|nr:hypothetical protein C8Q79DRAFT_959325 [Trametes meyenii]
MQYVEYYQIGGFGAHLWDNSNEALAARLMGRDGAEFVLGIRPNGASALLLPSDLFLRLVKGRRPYKAPYLAEDFQSLSPVQFPTKLHLVEKLNMLASKKSKGTDVRDRSKANTAYTVGGDALSPAGVARSSFEHQRVFYMLCQNTIKRQFDYALCPAPWFHDVRIFSFAFNTWASDTRPLDEREAQPKILDVGWTEFNTPTDSSDLVAMSTSHYVVEEEKFLNNPGRRKLTLPNVSQNMPKAAISTILKNLFNPSHDGASDSSKILLVHDERATRCALRSFGVDTSQWKAGIKDLLYHHQDGRASRRDQYSDRKFDGRDHRLGKWKRDRSISPRMQTTSDPRRRSPPARQARPFVYLVDVRRMYHNMMEVPPRDDTVLSNALALSVRDTAPARGEDDLVIYEDIDPKNWCAGRESRLIGYMWEDMANGIAIDEQRALRIKFSKDLEEHVDCHDGALGATGPGDEVDPNDILQPCTSTAGRANAQRPIGMFDSESEDEEW